MNDFAQAAIALIRYEGIADTFVQLICRSTSSVIAPSQPIRSDSNGCKNGLARTARPSGEGPRPFFLVTGRTILASVQEESE
jgi:hypothetical protein